MTIATSIIGKLSGPFDMSKKIWDFPRADA
jgi:hypothetical protein